MINDLKAARIAAGLTQRELAERAGISKSLLAFAERGAVLSPKSMKKVTAALVVTLEEQETAVRKARNKISGTATITRKVYRVKEAEPDKASADSH